MPAGLYVVNDSDVLQIDENFFVMQVVNSGSGSFAATQDHEMGSSFSRTIANTSILLLRPTDTSIPFGVIKAVDNGNGTTTWTYVTDPDATTKTLSWFEFGRAPVPVEDAGLEVFNAAGELVFSSERVLLIPKIAYAAGRPMYCNVDVAVINDVELLTNGQFETHNGWIATAYDLTGTGHQWIPFDEVLEGSNPAVQPEDSNQQGQLFTPLWADGQFL